MSGEKGVGCVSGMARQLRDMSAVITTRSAVRLENRNKTMAEKYIKKPKAIINLSTGEVSLAASTGSSPSAEQLLADLFKASSELQFALKGMRSERITANSSWQRHTKIMKRVEDALKEMNKRKEYDG